MDNVHQLLRTGRISAPDIGTVCQFTFRPQSFSSVTAITGIYFRYGRMSSLRASVAPSLSVFVSLSVTTSSASADRVTNCKHTHSMLEEQIQCTPCGKLKGLENSGALNAALGTLGIIGKPAYNPLSYPKQCCCPLPITCWLSYLRIY